jgi:hypothetical protein
MSLDTINIGSIVPSAQARKIIYGIFGAIGLVIGATQTAYSSAGQAIPIWLVAAMAVYGYLAAAGFGVAYGNAKQATIQA